jgi:hypothetical protein
MKITNLITAPLKSASATPQSNLIGAKNTEMLLSLTLRHKLPAGGRIMLQFEKYNPLDFDQNSMSNFSNDPTCTGIQNIPVSITCVHDRDNDTIILMDLEGKPPNSELIFKVDSFRNPFDSRPRSNLKIFT